MVRDLYNVKSGKRGDDVSEDVFLAGGLPDPLLAFLIC
jgi:hypothetical protein